MPLYGLYVSKEELDYLLNLLKRKQLASEHIIKNPSKYDKAAVQRAKLVASLANSLIGKLEQATSVQVETEAKPSNLEQKLNELELKVNQLEIIVKKLVAYHKGEI